MSRSATVVAIGAALLLGSCAEQWGTFGVVAGSASYDEAVVLPADAMLEVRLFEVAQNGEGSRLVAQQVIKSPARQPVPFQVRFDPRAIDPDQAYVIRARFTDGREALLETSEPFPILTQGHPQRADLVLERAGSESAAPAARSAAPVELIPTARQQDGQ